MYRRMDASVGMSGIFDSITNFFKGIKITAPPINLPTISFPPTYQIPGTSPPPSQQQQIQATPSSTPDWLLPVGLGVAGLVAVMMLSGRRR